MFHDLTALFPLVKLQTPIPDSGKAGNGRGDSRSGAREGPPGSRDVGQFRVYYLGFIVYSLWFRVQGLGFRVQGLGFRV